MKEAAGEANMTVITIVLIAIVLAVGTVIVTNVMNNTENSSACSSAGGIWQGNGCYTAAQCVTADNGATSCSGTPAMTCSDGVCTTGTGS